MKSGLNRGQNWCCGRKPKPWQFSFIYLFPCKHIQKILSSSACKGAHVYIHLTHPFQYSVSLYCFVIIHLFVLHSHCPYMPNPPLLHSVFASHDLIIIHHMRSYLIQGSPTYLTPSIYIYLYIKRITSLWFRFCGVTLSQKHVVFVAVAYWVKQAYSKEREIEKQRETFQNAHPCSPPFSCFHL